MPKTSYNRVSEEFLKMLAPIEPSIYSGHLKHYPSTVTLRDGSEVERVICVEDHRGFKQDWWIHPENVAEIRPSQMRMPAGMASELYKAGESGIGCQLFKMRSRGKNSSFSSSSRKTRS